MSFLTSVLLFTSDTEAVERLNEVIKSEWGPFERQSDGPLWSTWALEANHLRVDDLITLINANVWRWVPQLLTMTEDERKFTDCKGIKPLVIKSRMLWHVENQEWIPDTYIERAC